jgi:hypothetical protein
VRLLCTDEQVAIVLRSSLRIVGIDKGRSQA